MKPREDPVGTPPSTGGLAATNRRGRRYRDRGRQGSGTVRTRRTRTRERRCCRLVCQARSTTGSCIRPSKVSLPLGQYGSGMSGVVEVDVHRYSAPAGTGISHPRPLDVIARWEPSASVEFGAPALERGRWLPAPFQVAESADDGLAGPGRAGRRRGVPPGPRPQLVEVGGGGRVRQLPQLSGGRVTCSALVQLTQNVSGSLSSCSHILVLGEIGGRRGGREDG